MNPKRPDVLFGKTPRVKTGCGWLYVTINHADNKPFEILPNFGKAGGCATAWAEAGGRLASLALRYNAPIEEVAEQLQGISCPHPAGVGENKVLSCIDGLASILLKNKELSPPLVKSEDVEVLKDKVDNNPDKADKMITLLANNGEITGDRGKW